MTYLTNPHMGRILSVMIRHGRYMSTAEIAKESGMSWNTAEKYLVQMHNKGWITKKKIYWKAIIP